MTTPTPAGRYGGIFDDEGAARYNDVIYGEWSRGSLLWEVQRDLVGGLLDDPSFVPERRRYLDFACGAGRITAVVAPRFESSVGVDVAAPMLARAAAVVPEVELRCVNLLVDPDAVQGPFDLVTMFRFVLNADPGDAVAALVWARSRLRDDRSRVLVNNHGNQSSYLFPRKVARVAVRRDQRRGTGNIMSHRHLTEIFGLAGFDVERRQGCGVLPARTLRAVDYDRLLSWERRLQRVAGRVGVDQLYVLRPI